MRIGELTTVRTGLVSSRKSTVHSEKPKRIYRLLNLKCVSVEGYLNIDEAEPYEATENLKEDYLTHLGDVLIRLSAPYTAVLIDHPNLCGFIVPSHFAILRTDPKIILPGYLHWFLQREQTKSDLTKSSSGSTSFGTISAGAVSSLSIPLLPISEQERLANLWLLTKKEQELLRRLAEEKRKENALLLDKVYKSMKRGSQI